MNKIFASAITLVLVTTAYGQIALPVDTMAKTVTSKTLKQTNGTKRDDRGLNQVPKNNAPTHTLNGKKIDLQPIISKGQFKSFGGVNGGGGDEVGLEFKQAFYRSLYKSKDLPVEFYKKLMAEKLEQIADQTSVFVTDAEIPVVAQNLIQNSVAYNEPASMQILVNRKRWLAIRDPLVKEAIALHEISSLKGIERTGYYPYSAKYLSLVGGNSKEMQINLNVDRIKQAVAQMGESSKADIIKELYFSATAAVIEDIPFLSQSLNHWGGCAGFDPNFIRTKPLSLIIAKYYTNVVDSERVTAEDGPLFQKDPTENHQKLVVYSINRAFIEGKDFKPKPNDIYPDFEVYKDSVIATSKSITPEGEIPYDLTSYVNAPEYYARLSIRKDNQYLYLAISGKQKGQVGMAATFYAYCWRK